MYVSLDTAFGWTSAFGKPCSALVPVSAGEVTLINLFTDSSGLEGPGLVTQRRAICAHKHLACYVSPLLLQSFGIHPSPTFSA
jgi:hypothetical protein